MDVIYWLLTARIIHEFDSHQCRHFLWAPENLLAKLPEERRRWGESKGAWRGREERRDFFLPSPSPFSFFRPRTYRKGYYFYSPQSSTIMKSKMAATTIFWTQTRFRPTKIRLHSCRLWVWELASFLSLWPSRPISIKNNNNYWTRLSKNIVICQ